MVTYFLSATFNITIKMRDKVYFIYHFYSNWCLIIFNVWDFVIIILKVYFNKIDLKINEKGIVDYPSIVYLPMSSQSFKRW